MMDALEKPDILRPAEQSVGETHCRRTAAATELPEKNEKIVFY